MRLKKLLLVCGFGLSYLSLFAVNASVPEYDNLPITTQTWQEVDLTYDKYIDGKKYTEKANLLRPIGWLEKRELNKSDKSLVYLSEEDIGFDVIARVVAIKPANIHFGNKTANKDSNRLVIGTFLKYSNQVTEYTFEDTVTHKQETIKATPEHPFYSINRHDYIPIGEIWRDSGKYNGKEQLQTDNGHNVILVSAKPHNGQVEVVHNFEVKDAHNYFVGDGKFLVHNAPCNIKGMNSFFSTAITVFKRIFPETGSEFEHSLQLAFALKNDSNILFRGEGRSMHTAVTHGLTARGSGNMSRAEIIGHFEGQMDNSSLIPTTPNHHIAAKFASLNMENGGSIMYLDKKMLEPRIDYNAMEVLSETPDIARKYAGELEYPIRNLIPLNSIIGWKPVSLSPLKNAWDFREFRPNPHYTGEIQLSLMHD